MTNSDSDINLIIFFHVYINGDLNLIIFSKPLWSHQNICQFISWSIKLRGNPQEAYLCQRQTLHTYRFGIGRTSLGIYKTCVRDKPNKAAEVEMGMCQRQNQQPAIWENFTPHIRLVSKKRQAQQSRRIGNGNCTSCKPLNFPLQIRVSDKTNITC